MADKKYRPRVAIVVINDAGLVLACERSDVPGAWQIPQGGINKNESPEAAMKRELEEEIGTSAVQTIGTLPHKIRYDWPPNYKREGYEGQEQTYFLVRLNLNTTIDLNSAPAKEFKNYEWISASELISRLSGFKKDAYIQALTELKKAFNEWII